MTVFEQQDNKGRELFKQYCKRTSWCKHHKDAKNEYSHWDSSYFSANTIQIISEIKERGYDSTYASDWWGEVYKYNELMKIKKKYKDKGIDVRIHYVNIFQDNTIIIWDITDITLDMFKIKLNATTMEDNGKRDKWMYRVWKCESIIWDNIIKEPLSSKDDDDYEDDLPF